MREDIFAQATPTTVSGGGGFFDFFNFAQQAAGQYFQYDLLKREAKAAQVQAATSYAQGYGQQGYGYTGFTQDGGLVGGIAGLKGDQVFLLGMATIAIFYVARR